MITNQNTDILPLEILDRIFSFLDDEKHTWSTLKACSVIHNPVLRAAIDRHMYTHIHLCKWKFTCKIHYDEIYQYLSSNRHVADYVRTVDISMIPRFKDSYHEWYNQIAPILQMLPSSLKTITLSSLVHIDGTGSIVRWAWSDFPATFRTALLDCFWSPNITEASMQRIGGFPISIFNTCTRLKKLSLLDCTPITIDAPFPPQINSLVLSKIENSEILSWATMRHDLRSLKFELHNEGRKVGYHQFARLLDSYSDNLVELELDFRPLIPSNFIVREGRIEMDPPLVISHIQKLTLLTVSVYLDCKRVDSLLPGIISLAAASLPLKRLVLCAALRPGTWEVTAVPDFFRPLVSLADHSSLEHIELRIMGRRDDWQAFDDIVYFLKTMPELKIWWNKGFLSVRGLEFE